MRLLALILVTWLWGVAGVQARQSDVKHCEDAIDTESVQRLFDWKLTNSNSWVLNKTTNTEAADFLEARLEIHDHIVCGEKSGQLELVFVCSERAPIVIVTGTCRFADHARFGRFNIKIAEERRQKFVATALGDGNALGPSDAKDAVRIVNAITNAEKVTIQIQPFPWLPTNATFYPTKNSTEVDEIRAAYLE
jgi:hypothetical protein